MKIHLYIIAGGQSSRFGQDKARARLRGQTLIEHVAGSLASATSSVTVVADRADKYQDLGLRTIPDAHPGKGPLAGLEAALLDVESDAWLLLVSCDVADLQASWVQILIDHIGPTSRAVAFHGERWEPLFALYQAELLPEVTGALAKGDRAMWRFLDQIGAVAVPLPRDWELATGINTREELEALEGREADPPEGG